MIKHIRVIESNITDPYRNLAYEEYLLSTAEAGALYFYLWQNSHTVVIGANQNCMSECRVDKLEADGGRLARRISGGGAVYHDMGNLNFSFITARDCYDQDMQTAAVLKAVRSYGIEAEHSGRNDLKAYGKKFSGSAFHHGANSLRHGTLLIDSDIGKLWEYLNAPGGKLAAKGVRSAASAVVNLKELNPAVTVCGLKAALISAVSDIFDAPVTDCAYGADTPAYEHIYQKHISGAWKYRSAQDTDYRLSGRFGWGNAEICFGLKDGAIHTCTVFTDAMDTEFASPLERALTGVRFAGGKPAAAASSVLTPYVDIRDDIVALLTDAGL